MRVHGPIAGWVLIAALGMSAPATANAQRVADRALTLVNRAPLAATEVYVSPADAPDWGDERLGGHPVAPGRSVRLRLGRLPGCAIDVQFVYGDGSREERHGVDVCRTGLLAFDGSQAIDVPSGEPHEVALVNGANRPIQQVFLSVAEAAQWGEDRAAQHSVSVGERLRIDFRGGCAADLRVVYDNRAAEERRGIDVCANPMLSIEPGWTTADRPLVPLAPPAPEPDPAGKLPAAEVAGKLPAAEVAGKLPAVPPPPPPAEGLLRVRNATGYDISELYLYPEGQADHGRDLLGRGVLRSGDAKDMTLARGGACRFAAHLVFTGQHPDREVAASDLCKSSDLTLAP